MENSYGFDSMLERNNREDISDKITFPEGTLHGTAIEVKAEILVNLNKK